MTVEPTPGSGTFGRVPRRDSSARSERDRLKFTAELAKIAERLERVRQSDRSEFQDGSPTYDSASIAVVRLAALLERSEFSHARSVLTDEESRGMQTIGNIISHGGYADMNDDVFWKTTTSYLPDLVRRLGDAANTAAVRLQDPGDKSFAMVGSERAASGGTTWG